MALPQKGVSYLRFRHSDTGLAPTFTYFRRGDTNAEVTPRPPIYEISGGVYAFEWTWFTDRDPDIAWEVDGGPSIQTEEIRYIGGAISVRDYVTGSSGGGGGGWSVG